MFITLYAKFYNVTNNSVKTQVIIKIDAIAEQFKFGTMYLINKNTVTKSNVTKTEF